MEADPATDEKAQTRARILHAAIERIKHYGYGKTTMAEIAADCAMSAANIYRFFESKLDIAAAMAEWKFAQLHDVLRAVATDAQLDPRARLRAFFTERLRETYAMVAEHDRVLEVAQALMQERPAHHNKILAAERVLIVRILEDGAKTGAFAVSDFEFTAEMLQSATLKFSVPQLFTRLTLDKLERELAGVLDIMLTGIDARATQA